MFAVGIKLSKNKLYLLHLFAMKIKWGSTFLEHLEEASRWEANKYLLVFL